MSTPEPAKADAPLVGARRQCDRCPAIEDENRYLRRLLALDLDADLSDRLAVALRLRPQEARILTILYQRKGRVARKGDLFDHLHPNDDAMDHDEKIVDVLLSSIRKKLGAETVGTIWGRGVVLTADGMARVEDVLGVGASSDASHEGSRP